VTDDLRRQVPPTNELLAHAEVRAALGRWSRPRVLEAVRAAQQAVRSGQLSPERLVDDIVRRLPARLISLQPVLNATGVVLHTNLGRAPLGDGAIRAMVSVAGYVDVEFNVADGSRQTRGLGALAALRDALPDAGDVHVVNNGAAALLLAVTVLGAGREVIWGRGELVEIGDGFRLPDLAVTTGARLREVGTTNRTNAADYAAAVGPDTGCLLKVHPSNFRVQGFTSAATVAELAQLDIPLVVDVGSGLLRPDPMLLDEPDITTALRDGASLVTASGDKLLGGPQVGILAGDAALIEAVRRHPLARALRVDKLTLAALEATLLGPPTPVHDFLHALPDDLQARCERLADRVGGDVIPHRGAVGGGGAPGLGLPGWAVSLPPALADTLRLGDPCVVATVAHGRCLIDLRCIPPWCDDDLTEAVLRCR
jgi:L-seryl-tRNA(Ser) seleniumtransferase